MPGSRRKSASTQGHTYVIDQSYRVVYLDRAARRVFPGGRVGELCYECFRGQSEPCKDCPWNAESNEHATQSVIYSARTGSWYEITCLELDWFNEGPCVLFSGHPVDEHSRSLFTSLSEPSSYDELFELNLTDDAYKILYHEPGKFTTPPLEGRISDMFPDVRDRMIHPEDRDRFHAFWDFDTLLDRIEQAGGALRGEFRKHLESGAWSWTSLTVAPVKRGGSGERVVMCFIADIEEEMQRRTDQAERSQIQLLRERDQLTGLYNAATFYDKAEHLVADMPDIAYDAAYIDIEHFKIYNEWHGREAGDAILRAIASRIGEIARKHGGIAGYLGGDDFTLLLPHGLIDEKRVESELKKEPFDSEDTIGFQPAFGVCAIDSPDVSVVTACDHAMIAMNSVKGAYTKRIAWYEAEMTEEMETEAKILLEVKRALTNHEFVLHWQPQCNTRTERIVGLEALVRWQHPSRGIVMPGAFIPVLERNNFIASLDLYVWEEACRHIRSWIDRGGVPIPVSVNISRADLYAIDVVEALEGLVSRYDLDHRLLELEITESAYAEDEKMADAVARLKGLGFTILMDDFGSGYSSLNMLKDINVDVLKIDMRFLDRDDRRSKDIMESVIRMARWLDLPVIAEGVETREQVNFLLDVGCSYAQGYYYARPMEAAAFEALLTDGSKVQHEQCALQDARRPILDFRDLLHENTISDRMLSSIIGSVALYSYADGDLRLIRGNEAYRRLIATLGEGVNGAEEGGSLLPFVHDEDRDALVAAAEETVRSCPDDGVEVVVRRMGTNGCHWHKMRLFHLNTTNGSATVYGSVTDVTERMEYMEALRKSEQRFEMTLEASGTVVFELDIPTRTARYSEFLQQAFGLAETVANAPEGFIEQGTVAEESIEDFRAIYRDLYAGAPRTSAVVRAIMGDGSRAWNRVTLLAMPNEAGAPVKAVGLVENVTRETEMDLLLKRLGRFEQD